MYARLSALGFVFALVACGEHDGHDHGSTTDDGDEHQVRDPETEPCDATNWEALAPDLRQCALPGIRLDGEALRRANLTDADLTAASLQDADLFKAILVAAVAPGVDLRGAKLTSADLTDADLTGATLTGATLINATLDGALLEGAVTDETTICTDGAAGPCW